MIKDVEADEAKKEIVVILSGFVIGIGY